MDSGVLIFVLLVPFVALYFLVLRPAQARNRRTQQVVDSLQPGHRVMTTSGLFGTVVGVEGDVVELQVSDGVVLRFARRAIGQVLADDLPPAGSADDLTSDT